MVKLNYIIVYYISKLHYSGLSYLIMSLLLIEYCFCFRSPTSFTFTFQVLLKQIITIARYSNKLELD